MTIIKKWKDPMSALTHFIGLLLAIPCAIILIYKAAQEATVWHVISLAIFGAAIIMLYLASTVYHMLPISEKASNVLRRIDHMMIFVLIAGSYTPICLVPLRGIWGWGLLIAIRGIALAGIVLKALWINAPRALSTTIYVVMGWLVVVAFYPLCKAIPKGGIALLVLGGVTYTVGAVIYGIQKPKLHFKLFGFHEIFHLFVMGGSFFHVLFMYRYILMG